MASEEDRFVSEMDLLEEELLTLRIKGETLDPKGKPSLVCSVFTDKFFNKESFRAHFKKLWKAPGGFEVDEAGPNLFVIRFNKEEDLIFVQHGNPWLFRGSFVLMKRLDRSLSRKEVQFESLIVWVRLFSIPPGSCQEDLLQKVGVCFIRMLDHDIKNGAFKVKVELDLRKPIRRGMKVEIEGDKDEHWIPFTFDNLPNHCIGCGRLGHALHECTWCSEEEKARPATEQPYRCTLKSEWGGRGVQLSSGGSQGGTNRQRNYLAAGIAVPLARHSTANKEPQFAAASPEKKTKAASTLNAKIAGEENNDLVNTLMETDGSAHGYELETNKGTHLTFVESTFPNIMAEDMDRFTTIGPTPPNMSATLGHTIHMHSGTKSMQIGDMMMSGTEVKNEEYGVALHFGAKHGKGEKEQKKVEGHTIHMHSGNGPCISMMDDSLNGNQNGAAIVGEKEVLKSKQHVGELKCAKKSEERRNGLHASGDTKPNKVSDPTLLPLAREGLIEVGPNIGNKENKFQTATVRGWKRLARATSPLTISESSSALGKRHGIDERYVLASPYMTKKARGEEIKIALGDTTNTSQAVSAEEPHRHGL